MHAAIRVESARALSRCTALGWCSGSLAAITSTPVRALVARGADARRCDEGKKQAAPPKRQSSAVPGQQAGMGGV